MIFNMVGAAQGGGGSDDNFKIAMGAMSGSIYDAELTSMRAGTFYIVNQAQNKWVTNAEFTELLTIPQYAFAYCTSLLTASFPKCTSIGASAFNNCVALSSLSASNFPVCTYIGDNAFVYCTGLKTADFPVCTYIGANAFKGCTSLTSASFPVCESIRESAFYNCSALSDAIFPECVSVSTNAFNTCRTLKTASFSACTTIGESAFCSCYSLSLASFPAFSSLRGRAFESAGYSASALSVYMPSLKYASNDCFIRANVQEVTFPVCSQILSGVFYQCSRLRMVSFPACTSIGSNTFMGCSSLMSVYLTNSVVASINGTQTFQSTPMVNSAYTGAFGSIYVPSSLVDTYKAATNWSYFSNRITAYIE